MRIPAGMGRLIADCLGRLAAGAVAALALGAGSQALAATCADMRTAKFPDVTITSAETVAAGAYKPPAGTLGFTYAGGPGSLASLPAFCRVVAVVRPVPDSEIGIEVWLPAQGWNGRYLQVGTHGAAGVIYWNEMVPQLRRGFAVGATDDGHVAGKEHYGLDFLDGHPAKVDDLSWRGAHELAVKAKLFIAAYYAQPLRYSYFNGCSAGGRQGVRAAQQFPDDFDGIVAGGAALDRMAAAPEQLVMSINLKKTGITGERGAAILRLSQAAATKACDGLDGVVDGIIANPTRCRFDPHTLVCKAGTSSADCITRAQADALAANYRDLKDPVTGKWISAGMPPGSEFNQISFGYHNALAPYAVQSFQLANHDYKWDGSTFDLHADVARLEPLMSVARSTNPDLTAFAARGGRMIEYHGWDDAAFTYASVMTYYDRVVAKTGGGKIAQIQKFYRLFMQPSIGHCRGGPGANNIGQEGELAVSDDPEHDVVDAIMAWVEKGAAPGRLIATKFRNDDPKQGIQLQRPLYPYPAETVWTGEGNPDNASNFRPSVIAAARKR